MIIGYARASIAEDVEVLDEQERALKSAGTERVFREQTDLYEDRVALKQSVQLAGVGDALVITKLDRLARSVGHLAEIVKRLERKRVALRVLDLGIDTSTPAGRLLVEFLGSLSQFEHDLAFAHRREEIKKLKDWGAYQGRKPTVRAQSPEVIRLAAAGRTRAQIATELGIGISSVYRILASHKKTTD